MNWTPLDRDPLQLASKPYSPHSAEHSRISKFSGKNMLSQVDYIPVWNVLFSNRMWPGLISFWPADVAGIYIKRFSQNRKFPL